MVAEFKLKENSVNLKKFLEKSKNILDKSNSCENFDIFISKNRDEALNIIYGINETTYGKVLLAKTEKGISDLLFITTSEEEIIKKLFNKWPKATFTRDESVTKSLIEKIFYSKGNGQTLKFHLTGTDFQIKIWQALLKIPEGYILSYSDISKYIKHPDANRAVGTAIGQNPVHYLIPCHRVIRSNGELGGYAGGIEIKRALLRIELNTDLSDFD